jgi:hypothetical protein
MTVRLSGGAYHASAVTTFQSTLIVSSASARNGQNITGQSLYFHCDTLEILIRETSIISGFSHLTRQSQMLLLECRKFSVIVTIQPNIRTGWTSRRRSIWARFLLIPLALIYMVSIIRRLRKEHSMASCIQKQEKKRPLNVKTLETSPDGGQTRVVFLSKSLVRASERVLAEMRQQQVTTK